MGIHHITPIPLWLLFFSLFLPRIALIFAFLIHQVPHVALPDWASLVMWALIPRVLMLIYIYVNMGFGPWFIAHLIALLLVWGGSGHKASKRWD
jgi:hypothetical protein